MAACSLVLIHDPSQQQICVGCENNTSYVFIVRGEVTFNGRDPIEVNTSVGPETKVEWHRFPFDWINDYPHFELEIERHSTLGHEETIPRKIKTKPRHFLNLQENARWENRPGRTYVLWNEGLKKKSAPIKIKTKKRKKGSAPPSRELYRVVRDLSELATIHREVDLHAEALFDDLSAVPPEDIFQRQMSVFREYLGKAKRAGLDRVFVIHGVGTGRLKNEIARVLKYDSDVIEFANEYHPKYGFGATEVILK